jgi:hypothetical protein
VDLAGSGVPSISDFDSLSSHSFDDSPPESPRASLAGAARTPAELPAPQLPNLANDPEARRELSTSHDAQQLFELECAHARLLLFSKPNDTPLDSDEDPPRAHAQNE